MIYKKQMRSKNSKVLMTGLYMVFFFSPVIPKVQCKHAHFKKILYLWLCWVFVAARAFFQLQ